MVKNIAIGIRLGLGFALVLLLSSVAMFITLQQTEKLAQEAHNVQIRTLPLTLLADEMVPLVISVQQWLTDVALTQDRSGLEQVKRDFHQFKTDIKKYREFATTEQEKQAIISLESIEEEFEAFHDMGQKMVDVYIKDGKDAGNVVMKQFDPLSEKIQKSVRRLQEKEAGEAQSQMGFMMEAVASLGMLLKMLTGITVLVGMVIAIWISLGITRPLQDLVATLSEVEAKGDFSLRSKVLRQDEVGLAVNAFNSLMDSLQQATRGINNVMEHVAAGNLSQRIQMEMKGDLQVLKERINSSLSTLADTLGQVSHSIRQVASAAGQTSNAVGQIADGSQNQMHATGQVAAAISQAYTAISEVTRDVEEASRLSRQTAELVHSGQDRMSKMIEVVNAISQSSERVSKITEVITKIATQTNLLSLNAAIEAARAGEHGKGFAVVAEEVRKLAENAEIQTSEITSLVKQSVKQAEQAVDSVQSVRREMDSITTAASETNQKLTRVVASMEQQSSAVEEIKSNISALRTIGDTNAAASEEITATVVDLSKLADNTRQVVDRFKV